MSGIKDSKDLNIRYVVSIRIYNLYRIIVNCLRNRIRRQGR